MSDKVNVRRRLRSFATSPQLLNYSKVIIHIDDYTDIEAGDDTGRVFELTNPFGTQQMAQNILNSLSGYKYQPYVAGGASLDPAAEIGDAVNVRGVYSGIYSKKRVFGRSMNADISAPYDEEINHEYQYKSPEERRFIRKMREVSAELAIKMDAIYARVIDENHSFGWELKSDGMEWQANGSTVMKLGANGLEVTGTIKSGSVITGTLNVGGADITAATLRAGANSGYNWANGSYGGYTPWNYSLTGGGYGFNFNTATTENTYSYPAFFKAGRVYAESALSTPAIYYHGKLVYMTPMTINGSSYTVLTVRSG